MKDLTPLKSKTKKLSKKAAKELEKKILSVLPSDEVTIKNLVVELNQSIVLARLYRQPSAMVAAIKAKAQLHGLLKDTTVHTGEIEHKVKVDKFDLNARINQLIEEKLKDALQ